MSLDLYYDEYSPRYYKILIAARYAGTTLSPIPKHEGKERLSSHAFFNYSTHIINDPILYTESGPVWGTNAILRYISSNHGSLYGASVSEQSLIDQWIDFTLNEVDPPVQVITLSNQGKYPKEHLEYDLIYSHLKEVLAVLEKTLSVSTFLVSHHVTIGDIAVSLSLLDFFKVADSRIKTDYPNTARWFLTLVNQPQFIDVLGKTTAFEGSNQLTPKPTEVPSQKKKEEPKKEESKKEAKTEVRKEDVAGKDKGSNKRAKKENNSAEQSNQPPQAQPQPQQQQTKPEKGKGKKEEPKPQKSQQSSSSPASTSSSKPVTLEEVLVIIDSEGIQDSGVTCKKHGWDHQDLVGILKKLSSFEFITMEFTKDSDHPRYSMTEESLRILANGSPEIRTFEAVPKDGISKADLDKLVGDDVKIGWGHCMKQKWLNLDKATKMVTRSVDSVEDVTRNLLSKLKTAEEKDEVAPLSSQEIASLKQRQLINQYVLKTYIVSKGPAFSLTFEKPATDLTAEMIASGSWKTARFKEFNFESLGVRPPGGHLHPLMKMRAEFRHIFIEMGFQEMPTNRYVESSFWNYDSLFQPQQHPVRDAHDTFFMIDPKYAKIPEEEYCKRVHDVHQNGGYGSIGWRYDWKVEEAQKNVLRTHTTAVSAQMLFQLGSQEKFVPKKYFSIDRVFRNESVDATHLAEFYQIEGVVIDYDLTLGNLIGILYEFYSKLGIEKLRFKPAYNPYTEPSMEIFSFHEGLNKWVEVGNSGMFRPEMLRPMNLPPNVRAIAWGLSLERPTMIKYGIKNIRDLVGPKVDIKFIRDNHIVRF